MSATTYLSTKIFAKIKTFQKMNDRTSVNDFVATNYL